MDTYAACPWSGLEPAVLTFCEESLCAWIRQPANTWSNLAYLMVGATILTRSAVYSRAIRALGWMIIAIGVSSFFYHASGTFLWELLDLGSMYFFSSLIVVLNLVRVGRVDARKWFPCFLTLFAASAGLFAVVRVADVGTAIFGVHLAVAFVLEVKIWRKGLDRRHLLEGDRVRYRPLVLACSLFVLAWFIWLTDYHRVICVPDRHWLTGHALWHGITAIAFWNFYRFYHQLDRAFANYA